MEKSTSLTYDVISKLVLGNMVKQCSEDWQQGIGGVVDILGHTLYLQEHTRPNTDIRAQKNNNSKNNAVWCCH